jgi:HEPN domain-containing protein
MISLGGLVNQKAFGKFEMGKVISNPFATAFAPTNEGEESSDYEVSMSVKQLDDIIKSATELKAKMGEKEFNVAAWIQDHISKSQDYINQANYGFDKNESVNEGRGVKSLARELFAVAEHIQGYVEIYKKKKGTTEEKKIVDILKKLNAQKKELEKRMDDEVSSLYKDAELDITESSIKEASPCWKGYKQVGMKDKGGKQVPNCVPNESVVREISGRTPKIFVKTAAVEKKIKELMADRKKAVVPYNNETDPKKKEILKQILIKLTKQIQGYEKNLVQLRDMEEEYIQQMQADAELDTSAFD